VLKLGDQAKLEHEASKAHKIVLDNLPDAVVVTAPDATVEMANAAARKLMGVVPGGSIYDTSQEWHRSLKSGHQPESADKDKHDRLIQVFVQWSGEVLFAASPPDKRRGRFFLWGLYSHSWM
jgi:PAS domain-containing protein